MKNEHLANLGRAARLSAGRESGFYLSIRKL
jgi:hypothetical protein